MNWFVSQIMMIHSRFYLKASITPKVRCGQKIPFYNCVSYFALCFMFFFILFVILLGTSPAVYFAFYSRHIFPVGFSADNFAFFALLVLFGTIAYYFFTFFGSCIFFARSYLARFTFVSMYSKFRKRFDSIAFGTFFCYSLLRHNQFLNNWLCLELFTPSVGVCSSLYFNTNVEIVK